MKLKATALSAVLIFAFACHAATTARRTIFIETKDSGFQTYLTAAIAKKQVPLDVVTEKEKANLILQAAPIEVRKESTGGKVVRCLFAYCAGIQDTGSVSVQLIDPSSSKVLWAYSVNKQRGEKNVQSMSEAVAKHLKEFLQRPINTSGQQIASTN